MSAQSSTQCQELKKINERLEQLQRTTSTWPDWKRVVTYAATSATVEQAGNNGEKRE